MRKQIGLKKKEIKAQESRGGGGKKGGGEGGGEGLIDQMPGREREKNARTDVSSIDTAVHTDVHIRIAIAIV